jgi:GntR family transcriptional repressor for pyruvate dehydrogenase complex
MNKDLFVVENDRKSAVDIVVDTVKTLLVNRKLKPGDMLPNENSLSESLHVSRGSIREAMKILSAFGIIEIRRGDGTYISTTANQRIFDPLLFNLLVANGEARELIELRYLVEVGIVELIIKNASDEDLQLLRENYEDLERKINSSGVDVKVLSESDLNFHYTMASITKNKLVENIYRFIAEIFAPTLHGDYALEPHRMIMDSLMKRDLPAAILAVKKHTEVWRVLMEKDKKTVYEK